MNHLRIVGRTSLVFLFAGAVLTGQASSQIPEQSPPPPPGQYEYDQTPVALDTPDYSDDVPAHLAIVDGAATIERDGRVETAEENIILLAGDRVRTERGRVEILFADGSTIDLDHFTRLDLMSDSLLRLLAGRVRMTIARTATAIDYRVDATPGSVWIKTAGDYRVTLADTRSGDQELGVTVLRGSAELRNPHGMTLVRAGTYAAVTANTAPSLPFVANSASFDDFDRWAEDQRDARYGVESARYLPEEVSYYSGSFDRYGSWDYLPTYGHVWYPRVAVGWRPYHHGRWSFGARFGWFWVGLDRHWGWATHHYGRWGYGSNRWFWIPGRRWSPAWVSWAYAPGYVSWCPLGFDNRPLISITNVFGRNSWHPWTFVPSAIVREQFPRDAIRGVRARHRAGHLAAICRAVERARVPDWIRRPRATAAGADARLRGATRLIGRRSRVRLFRQQRRVRRPCPNGRAIRWRRIAIATALAHRTVARGRSGRRRQPAGPVSVAAARSRGSRSRRRSRRGPRQVARRAEGFARGRMPHQPMVQGCRGITARSRDWAIRTADFDRGCRARNGRRPNRRRRKPSAPSRGDRATTALSHDRRTPKAGCARVCRAASDRRRNRRRRKLNARSRGDPGTTAPSHDRRTPTAGCARVCRVGSGPHPSRPLRSVSSREDRGAVPSRVRRDRAEARLMSTAVASGRASRKARRRHGLNRRDPNRRDSSHLVLNRHVRRRSSEQLRPGRADPDPTVAAAARHNRAAAAEEARLKALGDWINLASREFSTGSSVRSGTTSCFLSGCCCSDLSSCTRPHRRSSRASPAPSSSDTP